MILKITTLFVCLLHVLLPVNSPVAWAILNGIAILVLFYISGLAPEELLKRNILVVSFAVMIMLFQVITAVISGMQLNYTFMGITLARILFIYNMIMASVTWMGRGGLLWLVKHVPSERVRLFLLLFTRTVQMFMKLNRHIVFQLQSRIDTGSRKKYLVPRYYVQNLFTGEMYSLQHYQAGMMTRVHGPVRVLHAATISRGDVTWSLCVILLMMAGMAMMIIQV